MHHQKQQQQPQRLTARDLFKMTERLKDIPGGTPVAFKQTDTTASIVHGETGQTLVYIHKEKLSMV